MNHKHAAIILHPQPPILTEEFDPDSMKPALTVEGDVMLKEYDVLAFVDVLDTKLPGQTLKIARALHDLSEMEGAKARKQPPPKPCFPDERRRGQGRQLLPTNWPKHRPGLPRAVRPRHGQDVL